MATKRQLNYKRFVAPGSKPIGARSIEADFVQFVVDEHEIARNDKAQFLSEGALRGAVGAVSQSILSQMGEEKVQEMAMLAGKSVDDFKKSFAVTTYGSKVVYGEKSQKFWATLYLHPPVGVEEATF